jgi:hypothetical protein
MHAGAVFVTEHASGLAPFVADEHLLVSGEDSLPFIVEAVVRNPEMAGRLRTAAYERLTSWLPFALSIGVLRAALVELVGKPVPTGVGLGRRIRSRPVVDDSRQPSTSEMTPGVQLLARELLATRADLARVRRELALLRSALDSRTGLDGRCEWLQTPAWRARRTPRVTVVTVVNDAERIEGSLDSLTSSWVRDLELIIVCDSLDKKPARAVARWMHTHPRVPARLLFGGADLGLGVARNAALGLARAPCCLMFGWGEQLYPRCLEVLLGTIESLDVALVYPIVEVSGAVEPHVAAGGEPLVAHHGWDPGGLRLGPTVFSPYVVKTELVRSIGGFTENPQLAGWEDYDLLCEIASRGWRCQLVPQILARRRASSLIGIASSTDFADTAPIEALAERHPAVLVGLTRSRPSVRSASVNSAAEL